MATTSPDASGSIFYASTDGNGGAPGPILTGNAARDGTAGVTTILTSDSDFGTYAYKLRLQAVGTNVASVCRVFLNNGSSSGTAANNILIAEVGLPATTAAADDDIATIVLPLNLQVPKGWSINISLGTTVAAGYYASIIAKNNAAYDKPDATFGTITTANTAKDGTGTVVTMFTATAANQGYPCKLRFCPLGTNVATVARVFINNGSTNATPTNNSLYQEITLPATTLSETAEQAEQEIDFASLILPEGYKLNVTIGTTVAAGFAMTCLGGQPPA
jgi:hypothetical protein